jgi:CO/xanthine dehydrogenase Mo-binding subunit
MKHNIHRTVNGEPYDLVVESHHSLLQVLREQLVLTGTTNGCEAGECGACAVLMNGQPVNSCMVLAPEAQGAEIITIEAMAQLAAEGLGVRVDDVRVNPVDTDYSPYEWQTVASRLTWSMGNAVLRAADAARTQILQTVSEAWGEEINDLDIAEGQVISYRSEESLPLKNMVVYGLQRPDGTWMGGPVLAQGRFMPECVTPLDPETGQGPRAVVHFTTGAQAVEVQVDTETGEVQVLKIVSAFDVGRAINPEMVRTQMEGGAVQGMSTALLESLILDQRGVPRHANFTDYRIATAVDAPLDTENIIIEVPQDDGPFGARGVGEHPMVPTGPAIANAIFNATGVRIESMPTSSEKVWAALQEKGLPIIRPLTTACKGVVRKS